MAVGIASQPDYSTLEDPDSVFESSSSSVTEAEDPREDAIEVTAAELVEAYEKNEVQADETYEGQWVEVTGTVGDIKKDITDSVYVTIGKGEQFEVRQVQCFVDEGVDVTDLSKGDRITMTGRVDGLMMNVLVEECR
jgi:hypothetical protein